MIIILLLVLCSTSVLAISESEVQSQVAAQGKEAVTGNILIWFLCAVAFLKVSQKIDTFLSSLGINVGHTGGSMLGELMIAFKGIKGASGGAFGSSSGGHTNNNTSSEAFLSGGLAGAVGRTAERNAASSVTNQQTHSTSARRCIIPVSRKAANLRIPSSVRLPREISSLRVPSPEKEPQKR